MTFVMYALAVSSFLFPPVTCPIHCFFTPHFLRDFDQLRWKPVVCFGRCFYGTISFRNNGHGEDHRIRTCVNEKACSKLEQTFSAVLKKLKPNATDLEIFGNCCGYSWCNYGDTEAEILPEELRDFFAFRPSGRTSRRKDLEEYVTSVDHS